MVSDTGQEKKVRPVKLNVVKCTVGVESHEEEAPRKEGR